jgi:hypothetical protein
MIMKDETVIEVFARVKEALEVPVPSYDLNIDTLLGSRILPMPAAQPKKVIKCPHCCRNFDYISE